MSRETVAEGARESFTMGELAERLGGENRESFWEIVGRICPGFEKLVERNALAAECKRASDSGDHKFAHGIRREIIRLTQEIFDMGLAKSVAMASPGETPQAPVPSDPPQAGQQASQPVAVPETPATQAPVAPQADVGVKERPAKAKPKEAKPVAHGKPAGQKAKPDGLDGLKLEKVGKGSLKCQAAHEMVEGIVVGQEYHGRKLVVIHYVAGLFGDGIAPHKGRKLGTLHNGHINHCDIREGEPPTPYWAVMDAMSDLGEFTKEEAVSLAVTNMKKFGSKLSRGELTGKCGIAYDVLSTHERHPSKRKSGMSHICDQHPTRPRTKVMRGRKREETLEHFLGQKAEASKEKAAVAEREKARARERARIQQARADGKPIASFEVRGRKTTTE